MPNGVTPVGVSRLQGVLILLGSLALVAGGVFYLQWRSVRDSREARVALMKSVDASLEAHKDQYAKAREARDRISSVDKYVDSLVEEDTSAETREEVGSSGIHEEKPAHPFILKRPYPTLAQIEAAIGTSDVTESDESTNHTYPRECVPPDHVWRTKDPDCLEKAAVSGGTDASCGRKLLTVAFGKDGRLCCIERYGHGTEDIGRNWGWWSLRIP